MADKRPDEFDGENRRGVQPERVTEKVATLQTAALRKVGYLLKRLDIKSRLHERHGLKCVREGRGSWAEVIQYPPELEVYLERRRIGTVTAAKDGTTFTIHLALHDALDPLSLHSPEATASLLHTCARGPETG
jgi:hypothetical protein